MEINHEKFILLYKAILSSFDTEVDSNIMYSTVDIQNELMNIDNLLHLTALVYLILSDARHYKHHPKGKGYLDFVLKNQQGLDYDLNTIFKNIFNSKLEHQMSGVDNRLEFEGLSFDKAVNKYFEISDNCKYIWEKQ